MKIDLEESKIHVLCNLCGAKIAHFGRLKVLSGELDVFVEPCPKCYPPPENKAEDLE